MIRLLPTFLLAALLMACQSETPVPPADAQPQSGAPPESIAMPSAIQGVVLEDFAYPAWGVRWTTLEFSKYTPPQLQADGNTPGPDGNAAGKLALPEGGRIVLRTQGEAPEKWYGILGKPPWPLPAGATSVSLAVMPEGEQPVSLIVHFHDNEKTDIPVAAGLAAPGEWTTLTANVPDGNDGLLLHSLELARAGKGTQPQAVWIDDLRAQLDEPADKLYAAYGLCSYDRSLVVGDTATFFVRAQTRDKATSPQAVNYTVTRRGEDKPTSSGELAWNTQGVRNALAKFQADMPGVYDVELTWADGVDVEPIAAVITPNPKQQNLHRKDITFTVYRKAPLAGSDLETETPNLNRTEAAIQAGDFQAWQTNLSPAMLLRSPGRRVQLFAGLPAEGLALPKYVAFATADGVQVAETTAPVDLSAMSESWLVLFAGDAEGWDEIGLWCRGKRQPAPLDLPWLVVLQRKPDRLVAEDTRLVLEFPAAADAYALLPLHGMRTHDPAETAMWAKGLPEDIATHASTWARRLKRFPYYVKEDYKVDADRDAVTIRQTFAFHNIQDDWNTEPLLSAPVPPMLTLAVRWGMEIEFTDPEGRAVKLVDGNVASGVGPVAFIEGTQTYSYTIRNVLKYINEDRLPNPEATGEIAEAMIDHMRNHPGEGEPQASPSRWSPGVTVREDYGIAMVGNSERQGLLGSTIPYCDEPAEAEWRKRTLAVDAAYLTNPNCYFTQIDARSGKLYNMEGFAWTRFGLHNWVDNNAYIGDVLRALDYYVKYTGDLDLVRRHWPMLRASFGVVSDFKRHGEWELSCFDTGGGDTWDSTYNATVGFARLADRLGDGESYRAACYYHAKRAVTLAGQRQANTFIASMPYWASMQSIANVTKDGHIAEYEIFGQKWVNPVATIRDLAFTDVWGQNMGLRPWNQTCWMRGSRSEFRLTKDLAAAYATYWVDGRVKAFAPEWYQAVIVEKQLPPEGAIDKRTGLPVKFYDGDFAGQITLAARAIVSGDSAEDLYAYWKNKPGVIVFGETAGRVPRLCSPAVILEDGMGQPWVRLFGKGPQASSPDWERGRDAVMDLGDDNYMYGLRFAATPLGDTDGQPRMDRGVGMYWRVFYGPASERFLEWGYTGPADVGLSDGQSHGVTWNTTIYTAKTSD